MQPLRIIFMGTPSFSVAIFEQLLCFEQEGLIDLVCVVTRPDRPEGRKKLLKPSKLKEALVEKGKEHLLFETSCVKKDCAALSQKKPDLLLVAAFGQILSEEVLALGRLGCWNVHTSLLPQLRGAAPIQRAVLSGAKHSGVTIMNVVKALDAGAIFSQESVVISPYLTYGELEIELASRSKNLLRGLFERALQCKTEKDLLQLCQPQDESLVTWAEKIEKEEAYLDLSASALSISRKICGLDPKPGAFCYYRTPSSKENEMEVSGKRIKFYGITKAGELNKEEQGEEGTLFQEGGVYQGICTKDGFFCPKFVQGEGGKRMPFATWLRGFQGREGRLRFF